MKYFPFLLIFFVCQVQAQEDPALELSKKRYAEELQASKKKLIQSYDQAIQRAMTAGKLNLANALNAEKKGIDEGVVEPKKDEKKVKVEDKKWVVLNDAQEYNYKLIGPFTGDKRPEPEKIISAIRSNTVNRIKEPSPQTTQKCFIEGIPGQSSSGYLILLKTEKETILDYSVGGYNKDYNKVKCFINEKPEINTGKKKLSKGTASFFIHSEASKDSQLKLEFKGEDILMFTE